MNRILQTGVRLPPMPTVGSLLKLYKLRALKQLSQNFLLEGGLIKKIVKVAGRIQNGLVCEVGPGPGGLTRSILEKSPKHLLLVEKDVRFQPMLESLRSAVQDHCQVDIKYNDILGFKLDDFFDKSFKKDWTDYPPNIHIIGNLPFNVSTPLIVKWLRDISLRQNAWSCGRVKMTLTFQKEVAQRIVAPILSQQRCRLSVMCQNWCKVDHKFTIPGRAFVPRPDVDVGVVLFEPLVEPVIQLPFEMIEKVLRTIFNTRQKYIKHGIEKLFPISMRESLTEEVILKSELNPECRSFQLSVEEYGRIVRIYKEICDRYPSVYRYDFRGPKKRKELEWQEMEDDLDTDCDALSVSS